MRVREGVSTEPFVGSRWFHRNCRNIDRLAIRSGGDPIHQSRSEHRNNTRQPTTPTGQSPFSNFEATMSTPQHLAFFGATGGCALNALIHSLAAGHICTALARTPAKLTALLATAAARTEKLTIVAGDIDDADAVAATLSGATTTVLFGVGGTPAFSPNPLTCFVTLNDPTICERGITQVLAALRASGQRPLLCVISTTGLDDNRDLPLAMRPLYKALKVPHRDKKKMEELVVRAANEGVLAAHVVVRPALLTDGEQTDKLRAGYRGRAKTGGNAWGDVEGEAVGYTVSRKDVGHWIFQEVVQGRGGEWKGHTVSLAY